jgi:nucleoside-diphosphate-sugar epimerase
MPYTVTGAGKNGAIGTNLVQHLMKHIVKNVVRDEDPREALLKHAEAAASIFILILDDPYWVAPAYAKNQKDPILAKSVYEDEMEFIRDQKKRRKMPNQTNQ